MSLWICLDIFSTWYAVFKLSCNIYSDCNDLHKALPVFAEAATLPEQHYKCIGCTSHKRSWGMTTVFTNSSEQHDHFILCGRSSICSDSYTYAFVAVVTIGTITLRFSNSAFCPHSVLVFHSVLTINSDYFLLYFLTFIMNIQCVFCEADTTLLNVT